MPIELWVSTSVHETLLTRWTAPFPTVRIRRAPGFRVVADDGSGRNPVLPAKIPMLLRLLPYLRSGATVVACAEQTSLWLPRLFPMRAKFVKTSHGVGSMSARDDPRRRAAALTLVPSELERQTYLHRGFAPERFVATGYVKADFTHRTHTAPPFADSRPVVLYTPHWQQHRSSWWRWGAEVVRRIVADGRYNLIFAPHQRLVEKAPEVADLMREIGDLPHVHCDVDGFAMVDGSYTGAADVYLGDTSSQVIEFLVRPRPCVFLNAGGRVGGRSELRDVGLWGSGWRRCGCRRCVGPGSVGAREICEGSGGVRRAIARGGRRGCGSGCGEILRLLEATPAR
ncbi:hypothetical protein [Sphingomonas sp. LR55]|uniref:hypothetical protein n=1 Tax=Sphingomonas sp. LR55 TaxID=3050231 RepID=UPI002FE39A17